MDLAQYLEVPKREAEETGHELVRAPGCAWRRVSVLVLSCVGLVIFGLCMLPKSQTVAANISAGNVMATIGLNEDNKNSFTLFHRDNAMGGVYGNTWNLCLFGSPEMLSWGSDCVGKKAQWEIVKSSSHQANYHLRKEGLCLSAELDMRKCDSSTLWGFIDRLDLKIDASRDGRGHVYQLQNSESGSCLYMNSYKAKGFVKCMANFYSCTQGPDLGMWECLDGSDDQQWVIQSSDGSYPHFAVENHPHNTSADQLDWGPECENAEKDLISSVREIATNIGAGAKHHLLELETDKGTRLVTDLMPTKYMHGTNVVRCAQVNASNASEGAFVVNPLVNVSKDHTCRNMNFDLAHIMARNVTMQDFKHQALGFLGFYPTYDLLKSSCQTYSSWAYHRLTGCTSLTQTENGGQSFALIFCIGYIISVVIFCVVMFTGACGGEAYRVFGGAMVCLMLTGGVWWVVSSLHSK